MGRSGKQTFLQRRHTDGQEAHKTMPNITNYYRNANKNYSEVSRHTSQNGHPPKLCTQGLPGGPGIKNLPANAGTQMPSLVWEDPIRHRAATLVHHSYWARAPQREATTSSPAPQQSQFPLPLTPESPPTAMKTQKYFFKSTNNAGEGVEERQQSCTNWYKGSGEQYGGFSKN